MTITIDRGPEDVAASRLATLEARVGFLVDKDKAKVWYKDASTIISLVALLTSVVTFSYASVRDLSKDKEQKRADLQAAVVQLNSLTTESTQLYVKYKDNPDYYAFIQPSIKGQIGLVGTKAYTLLASLGSEASALDSAVVANALQQTSDYVNAAKVLQNALRHAKNPAEYVVVARMLGQFGFYRGKSDDGNKYFQLAEDVFRLFPDAGINQSEASYDTAETEAYWAVAAASQKFCSLAQQHAAKSREISATLFAPGQPNVLSQMLEPIATVCA